MKVLAVILRILGTLAGAFLLLMAWALFDTGNPGPGWFVLVMGIALAVFSILYRSTILPGNEVRAAERARYREEKRAKQEEARQRRREINQARRAQPQPSPTPAAPAPPPPVFKTKRMLRDERRAEAKAQGLASCPRCGSTSLSVNKKGFSAGQAYAGMFTAGGILLGAVGMNKLKVTCLNCGYRFKPGKGRQ